MQFNSLHFIIPHIKNSALKIMTIKKIFTFLVCFSTQSLMFAEYQISKTNSIEPAAKIHQSENNDKIKFNLLKKNNVALNNRAEKNLFNVNSNDNKDLNEKSAKSDIEKNQSNKKINSLISSIEKENEEKSSDRTKTAEKDLKNSPLDLEREIDFSLQENASNKSDNVINFFESPLINRENKSLTTKAKQAILIDGTTKTILFEKNARTKMYPSSMTKMMTLYVLFKMLSDGKISQDEEFLTSQNAHIQDGSKMFIATGEKVKVHDIIRGIAITSGNDASVVVAENIAGSESAFAILMMDEAANLGLTNTNFENCTGLPNENHYSTAYDIAKIAINLWYNFPSFNKVFSEKSFTHNNITQSSFNTLLFKNAGVDGIKTGHTNAGGYGVAVTAQNFTKNKRFFLVINGCSSVKERNEEALKILTFADRNFQNYRVAPGNKIIGQATIWNGTEDFVNLILKDDITLTLDKSNIKKTNLTIEYSGPINAPIRKNDVIGKLIISVQGNDKQKLEFPLYAEKDVEKVGIIKRMINGMKLLIFGIY